MNTVININDKEISIINFKSVPVITTEMLADFYGTNIENIRKNFSNNQHRFLEGKHFYKVDGTDLKAFKDSVNDIHAVKKNARAVNLWTERGAARHAKMLDTDQAWEVFEQLEDCYFHRKDILAKTHKSDRSPLNDAVNMLVAKTKHLNFSEAYKLVHQRFNVQHIEDIPFETIPVAVEYVHHLVAMFSQADKNQHANAKNIDAVARHMLWLNHWWSEFGATIRKLSPTMGHGIHDHFTFGAEDARQIVGREVYMPIFELAQKHNWHKGGLGFKQLQACGAINYSVKS